MGDREQQSCNSGGQFMDRGRMNQNGVVQPLLTDLYQITMAYAYWKSGKTVDHAVFDLFFRTNPFHGEFTIFAGLEECLKFLDSFHYSDSDIEYLRQTLPEGVENEFFNYLASLTAKDVTLYAIDEGTVAFPRVPIIKVEGPLIIVQLLETTLLTLVNYASLMATNAARYRMVAGKHVKLLEFGLRRAQGPDGGLSASKYSYTGGFDGTSNVLAGKLFNIPVKGTHAHAYITSFSGIGELKTRLLRHKTTGITGDLLDHAVRHRQALAHVLDVSQEESSEGELAAMVSYAIAFPDGFMALVDTYDVKSKVQTSKSNKDNSTTDNKIQTDLSQLNGHNLPEAANKHVTYNNLQAATINGGAYVGDLVEHNSTKSSSLLNSTSKSNMIIRNKISVQSPNDLKNPKSNQTISSSTPSAYLPKSVEKSFRSGLLNFCAVALGLNDLGYHAVGIRIDSGDLAYLSCLARETFEKVAECFKVPWFNKLTIVASNDINEDTILSLNEQGHKIDCFGIGTHLVTCQRQPALGCVYKLVEINGQPRIKLSQDVEKVTMPGHKNAFRLYSADGHALIDLLQKVTEPPPSVGQKVLCRHPFQESKRAYVIPTHVELLYKIYWKDGKIVQQLPTLEQVREKVQISLKTLRNDHKRTLNPTPYKVAVSDNLYNFIHDLWLQNAPIGELS
ncbi:nicotinate phosphoribosyltransferase isoform X1 [Anastrepha ludens]|uniref:nicotinate phosphoribosyltransferase isoform X1 n=1 Tax=Anastrepha ludens TaxID=28586 RepID=UPI0023B0C16E|nr:nicotinate phosphoribosyltransferase isoform X1 [Anastrepha ludens]XP_053960982.1 nicotinate phosphoribosyltransferase isoform X1 [Anastrepha ludens]XP_053960983.1 nicotinate phosphoribosyltransferase isoform X1 [Anastrepha ludens]XP_053960984.1 nicotinate phosphoribosyltransferase isoform X1 [Anastrepha ludens]XP_053960986.1 nicotinate phosphoribosyltransferase isoform X1 [Anastrepha ludens]XP_053960987.1 nicotinate phosphoribosyltransferase isoform X1 [Anastrepha ludens]XP_053960988.1 ni